MSEKILPCPFCGEQPEIQVDFMNMRIYTVRCTNYSCDSLGYCNEDDAIKGWNTREMVITGYLILSFTWERDGIQHFEMDVHEGTVESFLDSVKNDSEIYNIILATPISKENYNNILENMICQNKK